MLSYHRADLLFLERGPDEAHVVLALVQVLDVLHRTLLRLLAHGLVLAGLRLEPAVD